MDTATSASTRDIATTFWVEADSRPGHDLPFHAVPATDIGKEQTVAVVLPGPVVAALEHALENVDSLTCDGDVCIATPIGYYLDGYDEPEKDAYRPFYVFVDGTMRCEDCGNDELGI